MFQWVGNNVAGLLALWGCLVSVAAGVWCVRSARRKRGKRRCPGCGYDMDGIPGLTCPECGDAAKSEAVLLRRRVNRWWLAVCALGFVGSAASWGVPELRSGRWVGWVPTDVLVEIVPRLADPPVLTRRDADIQLSKRCADGLLSPRQWRRLVALIVGDQGYRFSTMSLDTFEFRNAYYLQKADKLGHVQAEQRARLDSMMQVRLSRETGGYVGGHVYARWHMRLWREWQRCTVRFLDPDSGELVEEVEWDNAFKNHIYSPWRDGLTRVARVPGLDSGLRARIQVELSDWNRGSATSNSETIQDEVVTLTTTPKPRTALGIIGKPSVLVESAVRGMAGTILGQSQDGGMVWILLDFPSVAAALKGDGIDTLALRVQVLRRGSVLGETEAWCSSADPRANGELIHIRLPSGTPQLLNPLDPEVRLRFIGDPLVAVRNPNAVTCWKGTVETIPKQRDAR